MEAIKGFISYSHEDEELFELFKKGISKHSRLYKNIDWDIWTDKDISVGQKWHEAIQQAVNDCAFAVLLLSVDFFNSTYIEENELRLFLQRQKDDDTFLIFPVLLRECSFEQIPGLNELQHFVPNGARYGLPNEKHLPFNFLGKSKYIDRYFMDCINALEKSLKKVLAAREKTGKEITVQDDKKIVMPPISSSKTVQNPEKINIFQMPATSSILIGRNDKLKVLDNSWKNKDIKILNIVGVGGAGKTALVNNWMGRMAVDNYRGAEYVYAWSFNEQDSKREKENSTDLFLRKALDFFSDPNPDDGDPKKKSLRLVDYLRQKHTLLIIDGIESIQYTNNDSYPTGVLKDRGLKILLKELAADQRGLCVITSHHSLTDVMDKRGYNVMDIHLQDLEKQDSIDLLKILGVVNSDEEIDGAVSYFGSSPLTLSLLGKFVKKFYNGNIREWETFTDLTKKIQEGEHLHRILDAYESELKDSVEIETLYLMALFNRDVEIEVLEYLKNEKVLLGINNRLRTFGDEYLTSSTNNLSEFGLMTVYGSNSQKKLGCHQLIREYFREKFKSQRAKEWKMAQTLLYKYYKQLSRGQNPTTLTEMEVFIAAIYHGCQAGFHEKVFHNIYRNYIVQGDNQYIIKSLGAFSTDLSILQNFFETPWSQPVKGLNENTQLAILNWVSFDLCALGRLKEAIKPSKKSLEQKIKIEDWNNAAIAANTLSEMMLRLGRINEAIKYASAGVKYSDKIELIDYQKEAHRATLAYVYFKAGRLEEASEMFLEAEKIRSIRKSNPRDKNLFSVSGFRYCEFLLEQGDFDEVIRRSENDIKIIGRKLNTGENERRLSIAINQISLGRAWMKKEILSGQYDFARAMSYLDRAVRGLTDSKHMDDLPMALLARSECHRVQKKFTAAWEDLNKVEYIAELGSMILFLADFHIEAAFLFRSEGNEVESKKHLQKAEDIINDTGYKIKRKYLEN